MVAQRASFRQGAPENRVLGVFAASRLAYASIVPYHSATYISTAQEDVLCGDHNGVAPKRQLPQSGGTGIVYHKIGANATADL
jgi:hypothetical protein